MINSDILGIFDLIDLDEQDHFGLTIAVPALLGIRERGRP